LPTLNDVLAGSLAQAVQVQQIIDALRGTPNKGVPVSLVSLNDATNYALTVQNDDVANSRALLVLKADGTTLIEADATGVTLGAPVNLPVGGINGGTALADGSVTNAKLGPDVARANLLTNGGFEIWQRGNGPLGGNVYSADRWLCYLGSGSSISITKVTNGPPGANGGSALQAVYTNSTPTLIAQDLKFSDSGNGGLRGKLVSFSAWVYCSVVNGVQLTIATDGTGTPSSSSNAPPASTWTRVTCTLPAVVPNDATYVRAYLTLNASCTALMTQAMLVVGSQPADYVPLHPADDLARCQRYFEVLADGATGVPFILSAYQAAGGTWNAYVPYRAQKAVSPTVTKTGATWGVQNAGQPSVLASNIYGTMLGFTITAAGYGYVTANATGQGVLVEANP
jgi:hypothetical protein